MATKVLQPTGTSAPARQQSPPEWDVIIQATVPPILPEDHGSMVDNDEDRDQFLCRLWMFSPISGQMMNFNDQAKHMVDPEFGYARDYHHIHGYSVYTDGDMDKFRRDHKLDPLIKDYYQYDTSCKWQRATVMEVCMECGHDEMEFFTMQLRSADEGQTVFFECPKCGHKWRTNN